MTPKKSSSRFVAVVGSLFLGLVIGACGSTTPSSDNSTTSVSPTSGASGASSNTGNAQSGTQNGSGGNGAAFCSDLKQLVQAEQSVGSSLGAGATKSQIALSSAQIFKAGIIKLQNEAPPEISAEFNTMATAELPAINALITANGNVSMVAKSVMAPMQDPKVMASTQHLSSFAMQNCGVNLSGVSPGGGSQAPAAGQTPTSAAGSGA